MAQIIKLKRSAVQGKVPTVSDLNLGELAINTYDGKLYLKKDSGTASVVEIGAGGGGGSAITVQDEGTNLTTGVTSLNFVGDGVTATNTGNAVTVTVSGSGGSSIPDYILFSYGII